MNFRSIRVNVSIFDQYLKAIDAAERSIIAPANFDRHQQGQAMEGSAFSIDPATYAM